MSYAIETRLAPKAVYFTPQEARNYYGKYARNGKTVHWWGGGESADKHDNIVNYFLRQTTKSVNYVVSDNKITMMVAPDNVAWTSQSGNPTTISVEHQPTLGAEGYKKSGWLLWQLEQRYGRSLTLFRHSYWFATQCCGTVSTDRIRQEADKWARGEYNQQPTPAPTPAPNIIYEKAPFPYEVKCNLQPTNLWNFNTASWTGFSVVKQYDKGTPITIYGKAIHPLGGTYLMTEYSFTKRITNGFNEKDMITITAPAPEPPVAEWIANRKQVAIKTLYGLANAKLVDVNTMQVIKTYALDTPFEIKGETKANGNEFWFTTYSFDKGLPQGFLKADLKDVPEPAPPPPDTRPEWEKNLVVMDPTHYWFAMDDNLQDIPTGNDVQPVKSFKKDEEFIAKGKTLVKGVTYVITRYSLDNNVFNGVPIESLTLTPPSVPDIPPAPIPPADPNDTAGMLRKILDILSAIAEFLGLKKKT